MIFTVTLILYAINIEYGVIRDQCQKVLFMVKIRTENLRKKNGMKIKKCLLQFVPVLGLIFGHFNPFSNGPFRFKVSVRRIPCIFNVSMCQPERVLRPLCI